jgi:hypothetical protein
MTKNLEEMILQKMIQRKRAAVRRKMRRVMLLKRLFRLLTNAAYYMDDGEPRRDEEGQKILEEVQAQMRALPPFSDQEVETEFREMDPELKAFQE